MRVPVVTFAGTLGAGKTTLARATSKSGRLATWFMLLNDSAKTADSVDGATITGFKGIKPLPGGCFTCQTPEQIAAVIEECCAEPGIEGVLYEGKGKTTGKDTTEGFAKVGIQPTIVTLVDCEFLSFNRQTYKRFLDSQIAAATVAIGLTKVPEGVTDTQDSRLREAMDYIARFRKPDVPIFVVATKDEPLPLWVLERACEVAGRPIQREHDHDHGCGSACGHDHTHDHHDHGHSHDHAHDHDPDYAFFLKPGITFDHVRSVFERLPGDVVTRAKMVIDGHLWNYVFGKWSRDEPDTRRPGPLTILPSQPLDAATLAVVAEIAMPPENVGDVDLLDALHETLPAEEEAALIAQWADQIPAEPLFGEQTGLVLTYPEQLEIAKELARGGSSDAVLKGVIGKCMAYWLQVVPILEDQRSLHDPQDFAGKQRDLAAAFGFWSPKLGYPARAIAVLPQLLIEGFGALTIAPTSGSDASCSKFRRGVKLAIEYGAKPADFLEPARHCLSLAESGTDDEQTKEWEVMATELATVRA
ncbi:MAG TPA: GTP-binding protein [Candidatus Paceibacterota bacterium]|nr:GTP-binding protein [Candidatus Paceibacterota bacterium]